MPPTASGTQLASQSCGHQPGTGGHRRTQKTCRAMTPRTYANDRRTYAYVRERSPGPQRGPHTGPRRGTRSGPWSAADAVTTVPRARTPRRQHPEIADPALANCCHVLVPSPAGGVSPSLDYVHRGATSGTTAPPRRPWVPVRHLGDRSMPNAAARVLGQAVVMAAARQPAGVRASVTTTTKRFTGPRQPSRPIGVAVTSTARRAPVAVSAGWSSPESRACPRR